ncbi:hypothetical protein [Chloroflexus sp.]|uniref:hypothetical protein n=1 Tax=Chloroflexus sp. TaxID=1904827 RepID=UPI004048F602
MRALGGGRGYSRMGRMVADDTILVRRSATAASRAPAALSGGRGYSRMGRMAADDAIVVRCSIWEGQKVPAVIVGAHVENATCSFTTVGLYYSPHDQAAVDCLRQG